MPARPALATMDRVGIVFLRWRRYLQSQLAPHDITLQQGFVLQRLAAAEYLAPSVIARLLFCDRPTVTVVLRNLQRRGWVMQQRDPLDGRRSRVLLTPAGRDKLAELEGEFWRPLAARLDPLGALDARERAEFDRLITKVQAHVMRITQEERP